MKTQKLIMRLVPALRRGTAIAIAIIGATAAQGQSPTPGTTGPETTTPAPPAATDNSGNISHRGKEFLKDAAEANQMEISLGDVALEKSQNNDVRELAQTLRTDHQMNFTQLQAVARAHGVDLDTSLTWMDQRSVKHLQKADAADFDKEYTTAMLKDHVACIKKFDKAVADVDEADIKQYAQSTLPTLRGHLLKSEKAARAAGVEQDKIASILKELPIGEAERGVTLNQ